MKKLKSNKGFSLIELLVVIAIIGVLSAVGITAYTGYTATAKEQASRSQFAQAVSFVNAELAKCSLGSGNYAWPATGTKDACSAGVVATTDTNIGDALVNALGFKNPYDQTQTTGTATSNFVQITAAATTTPLPATSGGRISIYADASTKEITIKQRVVGTVILSQTVSGAN